MSGFGGGAYAPVDLPKSPLIAISGHSSVRVFAFAVLDRDPLFGPQRIFRPAVVLQCQDGNVVSPFGLSLDQETNDH